MGEDPHDAVLREYQRLAPRYDRRWASYVAATARETLRRLPPGPLGRLLDVGCGTGAFLAAVAAEQGAAGLSGVDLAPAMLAVARGRLPGEVGLEVASADALPFPDCSFDIVTSLSAFHFFRRPRAALAEICRVLRPGGALVLTDWCDDFLACRLLDRLLRLGSAGHFRIYGSAECRVLLEGAGFEEVRIERYRVGLLWGLMTAVARKPG